MDPRPLVTRMQAISLGRKRYYTGIACKHGHDAERFTSSAGCVECVHPKGDAIRAVGHTHKKLAHTTTLLYDRRLNADHMIALKEYLQQCADHWAKANEHAFDVWCPACDASGKVFKPEFGRCATCKGKGTLKFDEYVAIALAKGKP